MPQTIRSLTLSGKSYDFVHVPLKFVNDRREDVFANKNNKTLRETLDHRRYEALSEKCMAEYRHHLDFPLGEVVLLLKGRSDPFYTRFLNRYGDLTYSTFSIADLSALGARGVYAYFAGDVLKYIGRCKDSMRKRVNQGYGKIHPKNCFRDGQATNCHLNARITAEASQISLWLRRMEDTSDIETLERRLIRQYAPPWNIQHA